MHPTTKTPFLIGLTLTGLGCFMPWLQEGDFLFHWTYGIRLFPTIEDNGGLLVLFLTLVLAIFIFKPPIYITNPRKWTVALSVILMLDTVLHYIDWIFTLSNNKGIVGAPMIQIGLIMVLLGSITILITSVLYDRKQ